jgi:hypothetical protein
VYCTCIYCTVYTIYIHVLYRYCVCTVQVLHNVQKKNITRKIQYNHYNVHIYYIYILYMYFDPIRKKKKKCIICWHNTVSIYIYIYIYTLFELFFKLFFGPYHSSTLCVLSCGYVHRTVYISYSIRHIIQYDILYMIY